MATISAPLPVIAGSTDTWGGELNAWCDQVEAAVEAATYPDDIDINANLDFNNYLAEDLQGVVFRQQTANLTDNLSIFFKSNELFIKDGGGNVIQLTSGGAINAASVGGIGGDYGTDAGATVDYSTASTAYKFYKDTNKYGGSYQGFLRMYDAGTTSPTSYIQLAPPSGFAATSYTATLPGALPTSGTELMTISSAGVMDTTRDPALATVTTTGAATIGGGLELTGTGNLEDINVGGEADFTSNIVVNEADISIVTSGDLTIPNADMKHGTRTVVIGPNTNTVETGDAGGGASGVQTDDGMTGISLFADGDDADEYSVHIPLNIPAGKRITAIKTKCSASTGTNYITLNTNDAGTITKSTAGTTTVGTSTLSLTATLDPLKEYFVQVRALTQFAVTASCIIDYIQVEYDEV